MSQALQELQEPQELQGLQGRQAQRDSQALKVFLVPQETRAQPALQALLEQALQAQRVLDERVRQEDKALPALQVLKGVVETRVSQALQGVVVLRVQRVMLEIKVRRGIAARPVVQVPQVPQALQVGRVGRVRLETRGPRV